MKNKTHKKQQVRIKYNFKILPKKKKRKKTMKKYEKKNSMQIY